MPYSVDVNDPNSPADSRGAGQGAEELRAIKLKISGFVRNGDGTITVSAGITFAGALTAGAFTCNSLSVTGNTALGDGATDVTTVTGKILNARTITDATELTPKSYVDGAITTLQDTFQIAIDDLDDRVAAQEGQLVAWATLGQGAEKVVAKKNIAYVAFTTSPLTKWTVDLPFDLTDNHKIQVTPYDGTEGLDGFNINRNIGGNPKRLTVEVFSRSGTNRLPWAGQASLMIYNLPEAV